MAVIAARYPVFAPITAVNDGTNATTYGTGVVLGKLINTSVSPTYVRCSQLAGYKQIFDSATIALNTTHLPTAAYETMFGDYGATEVGTEGGFGFVRGEIVDGERTFTVVWIKRAVFSPPAESAVTKGANGYNFATLSVVGVAYDDGSGEWREKASYSSAAEAVAALKVKAGIA